MMLNKFFSSYSHAEENLFFLICNHVQRNEKLNASNSCYNKKLNASLLVNIHVHIIVT